jgi:hypothetical protein
MVERCVGVLIRRADPKIVGKIYSVFSAKGGDIIAAIAIGLSRLIFLIAERLKSVRFIVRPVNDKLMWPKTVAEISARVPAIIGIEAAFDHAFGVLREPARHHVDSTGDALRAVKKTLAAFQRFDAFHHMCWNRVDRCRSRIEPVVDANAVDKPKDILRTRALVGNVYIVEHAAARRDEHAWNLFFQSFGNVVITTIENFFRRNRLNANSVAR